MPIKETSILLQPTMEANGRDWADMLPELIPVIAKKVTEISDFIRLHAVCKTWRSLTTIVDLPPQFPWLLTKGPFDKSRNSFGRVVILEE
jgi:hypothetical protein